MSDAAIYMDNQATTPLDPRVLKAMLPYFEEHFGNAASRSHGFGWTAEKAVENARLLIADALGAQSRELIFTSGATESNNLAILGAARMYQSRGKHIVTAATEHKAVLDPFLYLQNQGWEMTVLDVDEFGRVSPENLRSALREDTTLVSIMHGNNEVGTLHPIAEIGAICHEHGALFHCDATQTLGKENVNVEEMNIDLLSCSAHKLYGPKGVGALYIRRRNPRVRLEPLFHGGGHERGFRSGTLNVPGVVGLATALEICLEDMDTEQARIRVMRDRLQHRLLSELDYTHLNGHPEERLATNLNISFEFVEGESMLMGMDGIAVSSGSACTSASLEPSYVLRALGVGDDKAHSSIRFSLGRFNTEAEVEEVADRTIATVQRLREMSPLYEMAQEGINIASVNWSAH
ncbi:MAG TPA: IscS subfamily cysteine desulfurase [Planctomycetota bacterium]|jgi:cysteine desulfurase|nr:IscS subfamily cysteine desulfurase [Planctomycetota bacterium]MDP6127980.1 IscS subfamily cysteine desulfurase [Planctomycetota bacterium]HJM40364.1 IscS subfamily cysteine desulfurase [Planctomycetota bacterium]